MSRKTIALGVSLSMSMLLPFALPANAAGPASSGEVPLAKAKRIPAAGIAVPAADREELEAGVAELGKQIAALRAGKAKPAAAPASQGALAQAAVVDLLPDVEIFYNAVHYALKYDEFLNVNEIGKAKVLLKQGLQRAAELREGQPGWVKAAGLVVRGYVSKIDGSVQPYGLVVPVTVAADPGRRRRLDLWFHGRGENLTEINFLTDRQKSPGEFTPPDTIVLHPYGRYCNGNRFAGEVDSFEAIDSVKKHYGIDDNRILARGFSMGGAACWTFATHHAGFWAAAAPGAGYSETAQFLHIADLSTIPAYQQKLWHLYDSTDYAINLFNLPTVAYSGELDAQKQAADMMVKACAQEKITLTHIIGPGAHHNYVPVAKTEINRRLDSIAAAGRKVAPRHIKFTTWSLRYNSVRWVTVDALEHHWERARVDAEIAGNNEIHATTQNVTELTFSMPSGYCPFEVTSTPKIAIDGQEISARAAESDRSWLVHLHKSAGKWQLGASTEEGLHKRHGLQGPIDDAFMDSFIMVTPTGKPLNEKTGAWVAGEQGHAIDAWRKQFRGEARVKTDAQVTDDDIASNNLVLWGDPASNAILAKIGGKLPIAWSAEKILVGKKSFEAGTHVPVLIYPNPLNPKHYVVINSGFTYREYDYENNARQTPKLPDWAIVDTSIPPTAQTPGGIPAAGFFDEKWELGE